MALPRMTIRDVLEARGLIRKLAPGMDTTPLGADFELSVQAAAVPRMRIFRIEGRQLRFSGRQRGFFGGTLVVKGSVEITDGRQSAIYGPNHAHIAPPSDGLFEVQAREPADGFGIVFDTALARAQAERLKVDTLSTPRRIDLRTRTGAAMRRLVLFAWRELESGGPYRQSPEAGRTLAELLCSMFLLASRIPEAGAGISSPLERAEKFLAEHLHHPMRGKDIAAAAAVNHRTLYRAFQAAHGMGPVSWQRQRRLEASRDALIAARPKETTVTAVALSFGFTNLGRFSRTYREAFNENPAETLRGT